MNVILTCNAGSTNTKLAAFDTKTFKRKIYAVIKGTDEVVGWLNSNESLGVSAVVHRVVHGGCDYTKPERITKKLLEKLNALSPLAPLHQPPALKLIEEAIHLYPRIPHIACFDTAFHHTMPDIERRLPLPQSYHKEGIMRYGFHGLSYQNIAEVLPKHAGKKANGCVIAAHLGGGSSACALKELKSVACSMGFSTLDGLMMGTRSGALDPGVVLHLLAQKKMTPAQITKLLYYDSGMKGVSGISSDMQELLETRKPAAREAVELYCISAARQIAGLLPALGGLDALVFTGGIGENAEPIRERITTLLRWAGDFAVHVIPANEEMVMAQAGKEYT